MLVELGLLEDSGAVREQAGWTERTIEYKMDNGEVYRHTNWFYLNADGALYTNGTYTVDGKSCTFDIYGKLQ